MGGSPQDLILAHLLRTRTKRGRTVKAIAEATGLSETAVRNNISVMRRDWIITEHAPTIRAKVYALTMSGRRVAAFRSRRI